MPSLSGGWSRLDNAALMYSALQREDYSAVYRFSALMRQPVDPVLLQQAVDTTLPRFPGFAVRIKRGCSGIISSPTTPPAPSFSRTSPTPASRCAFAKARTG